MFLSLKILNKKDRVEILPAQNKQPSPQTHTTLLMVLFSIKEMSLFNDHNRFNQRPQATTYIPNKN